MAMSCCAECGGEVPVAKTDFRPPPWCPGCGADLKLVDGPVGLKARPKPAAQSASAPEPTDAIATEMAPVVPSRRPILSSEPRAELPMPDGYTLRALQGQPEERRVAAARNLLRAGSLLLAVAAGFAGWSVVKLVTHRRVNGTVTALEKHVSRRGFVSYSPTVNFKVGTKTYSTGNSWGWSGTFAIGEKVVVLHPPDDPSAGTIVTFLNLWGWALIAGGIGGGLLAFGYADWRSLRQQAPPAG